MVKLLIKSAASTIVLLFCLLSGSLGGNAAQNQGRTETGPAILELTTNLADYENFQVPRYEKFELTLSLDREYANPFDPDVIRIEGNFRSPSHEAFLQPGFFYQAYALNMVNGTEIYTPVGDPAWVIRFTPRETGTYEYTIQVRDSSGTTTTQSETFTVIASSHPGFIQVSDVNSRYFAFDNGEPYFGIGLNVAWWQFENRRIAIYQYYFNQMQANKANLARVWMTNSGMQQDWILSIQDDTLGDKYNLEEAWAFDQILDMAGEAGVYLLLTLEDVNQYTYNWPDNLYNSLNAGPIPYRSAIFTSHEARQYQQRLIRYIIARWGYSPAVLSWELFNEIDELQWSDPDNWNRGDMIQWHADMGAYIRAIDAHHHLVNTSTGSFKTHPDLYGLSGMGFAQMHFYYVPGCCDYAPSDPAGRDMADLTRYYAYLLMGNVTDKPGIIGEWGVLNQNWTDSPYLALDTEGVHLHNGLWSSLMSGMASTGLSWHWQAHRTHDSAWWRHYWGIAEYFADVQITDLASMKPLNVNFGLPNGADNRPDAFSSTNDNLRVMGLRRGEMVYGWVQNKGHTWWNVTNQISVSPQSGTVRVLNLAADKLYRIEWWDTLSTAQQVVVAGTVTSQANGSLALQVNALEADIAFKIRPSDLQQVWLPFIRFE